MLNQQASQKVPCIVQNGILLNSHRTRVLEELLHIVLAVNSHRTDETLEITGALLEHCIIERLTLCHVTGILVPHDVEQASMAFVIARHCTEVTRQSELKVTLVVTLIVPFTAEVIIELVCIIHDSPLPLGDLP